MENSFGYFGGIKLVAVAISSRTKAGEINTKDVMDAVSKVCADHVTNQQPSTKDTKPKRKRSDVPKTDVVGQSAVCKINTEPNELVDGESGSVTCYYNNVIDSNCIIFCFYSRSVIINTEPNELVDGESGQVIINTEPNELVDGESGQVIINTEPNKLVDGESGQVIINTEPNELVDGESGQVIINTEPNELVDGESGQVIINTEPNELVDGESGQVIINTEPNELVDGESGQVIINTEPNKLVDGESGSVTCYYNNWTPGFNGGASQSFIVQHSTDDKIWVNSSTIPDGTNNGRVDYCIEGLEPDTSYYIRVIASNKYGESMTASFLGFNKSADCSKNINCGDTNDINTVYSSGYNNVLGAGIGIGVGISIAIAVMVATAIFIYRYWSGKRKKVEENYAGINTTTRSDDTQTYQELDTVNNTARIQSDNSSNVDRNDANIDDIRPYANLDDTQTYQELDTVNNTASIQSDNSSNVDRNEANIDDIRPYANLGKS
ncbi:hypothetical protein LOTGIDRAFT_239185 [Lottia gigantea]|uniref:Fibronectin type-III domain-containing protein n=1 Tax=Lottia gigantea TaxID=225164 RepID=V4A007_LOTGI|nr:hypothetical protein LOTGIDRAFT_239185 [Lottia gigantea]ESO97133.1 hypothetical protein LOTGIDRAFT_239185 [Lottia gigantea]